jgi:(1->4)-alpha-D-glucan 1-alpha-D-glucosylmutase
VRTTLDPREGNVFLADLAAFAAPIARLGLMNSLSQTLLRLTAPGVPDTYQGTELWDLSLVDPDNRRPVDYALRARLLDEIEGTVDVGRLSGALDDPKTKLFLLARALRLRRDREALFRDGEYVPLNVRGARADHVVAFARRLGEQCAVTVAPRLYGRLMAGREGPPIGETVWEDTCVELPQRLATARFENVLDGTSPEPGTSLPLGGVLASFPVALLGTR